VRNVTLGGLGRNVVLCGGIVTGEAYWVHVFMILLKFSFNLFPCCQ